MSENSTLVSIRLPDDLRHEVDEIARITKRSRSFVVKEAVSAFVQESRTYRAAIDEAVTEAGRGVFVSGEAVDRWLASWGTDEHVPPPEPDIFPDEAQ